jgi:transcriptional/translational regulatory protein YebC/TACO1
MMMVLDAGAEDFATGDGVYEIYTAPEEFEMVKEKLEIQGVTFSEAEISLVPENTVEVDNPESARKALVLIEALEDHDDVQNVYSNLDVPADILEKLENE